MQKAKKRHYTPSNRVHDFAWMVKHSEDLETKAKKQKDTSKLLYCCFELRNAIEMLEFHLLLASIPNSKHQTFSEIAKHFKGNEKANKALKALSYKTQVYYEIVCKESEVNGNYFNFQKSFWIINKDSN